MKPIHKTKEECKAKDGRTILVEGELYDEKIASNDADGDMFARANFIDAKTSLRIGTFMFPNVPKEEFDAQIKLMAEHIDEYLSCL